ncbi:flagellar hook protein FlgE [bacterium]|nr:flagellar hook protein FlgE [bacterium]RQV98021.1 MAG: flagellar hook protein FlgE [bacterium]
MMSSLFSAVSGLSNHQTKMDVIGDNLANVNTIGFKQSNVSFSTGFSQLLRAAQAPGDNSGGSNAIEIGLGSRVAAVNRVFTQGNFENTGNRNDLAIQGDGFFVVGDGVSNYYTRAGNFQIDANGSLLSSGGGFNVLGRLADKDGNLITSSAVEPLSLPFGEVDPARATTNINYFSNLDANASKVQSFASSFAFKTSGNPANRNTMLNDLDQVTSALNDGDVIRLTATNRAGEAVNVSFIYGESNDGTTFGDLIDRFNAVDAYNSQDQMGSLLSIDASGSIILRDNLAGNSSTSIAMEFIDADGSQASTMVMPTFVTTSDGTTGTHSSSISIYNSRGDKHQVEITFTQDVTQTNVWTWEATVDDGAIDDINARLAGDSGTLRFNTDGSLLAFEGGPLTFQPPQAQGIVVNLNGGTVGTFDGITQFAAPSTTVAISQDGHSSGVLSDFSVDNSGKIVGSYSNGESRVLGQIAIARFSNPAGLTLAGDNIYSATVNSGDPQIGLEAGTVNKIFSGFIELSTVDLAEQFTDMIIAQRGFQSNSRVITVADQLLNEVTQLKR